MLGTVAAKAEMKMPTKGPSIWKEVDKSSQTSLPAVFLDAWKAELDHDVYTILYDVVYSLIATPSMHLAASKLQDHLGVKVKKLNSSFLETV